jgi:hypothetical protein
MPNLVLPTADAFRKIRDAVIHVLGAPRNRVRRHEPRFTPHELFMLFRVTDGPFEPGGRHGEIVRWDEGAEEFVPVHTPPKELSLLVQFADVREGDIVGALWDAKSRAWVVMCPQTECGSSGGRV